MDPCGIALNPISRSTIPFPLKCAAPIGRRRPCGITREISYPPLGWGWRINFYEWMEVTGSEHNLAGIHRWNGAIDRFYIRSGTSWISEDGKRRQLTGENGEFVLSDEDGISRTYQGTAEKLVMTSIAPTGAPEQAIEICYSQNASPESSCVCDTTPNIEGKPCKLVPASGPALDIHWTNVSGHWMISSLSLGDEIVASYQYDSSKNLQNYYRGNTSSSENWIYSYANISPALLSQVQSPPVTAGGARVNVETHVWNCNADNCRVTRTMTPISDFMIDYGETETTVTDYKTQLDYTVTFNAHGLPLTMSPASACRSPILEYRYNDREYEPGKWRPGADVRAIKYADGSFTSLTLDFNGDPLKIYHGDNDDNAETLNIDSPIPAPISIAWHPNQRAPLWISRQGLLSDESLVIFDYEDPQTAPACSPGNCPTSLTKTDFNNGELKDQVQRIIRIGSTKDLEGNIQRAAYVQTFTYDAAGRLWMIQGPIENQLVTLTYWEDNDSDINRRGRLKSQKTRVSTTAELVMTFHNYDFFGNPTRITQSRLPKLNSTETDETWLLTYTNGRLATVTNPLGKTWTYHYTPTGTLADIVQPMGNAVKQNYSLHGLLSSIGRYPSLSSATPWEEILFAYSDGRGHLTQKEYKKDGVLKNKKSFGYDNLNRLKWEGIWRVSSEAPDYFKVYGYHENWRLSTMTDQNHALSANDEESAHLQYSYMPSGELLWVKRKNLEGTFESETDFSQDLHGNLSAVSDSNNRSTSYTYDDFDRIIEISGPMHVRYAYDAADRLIARKENVHMGSYHSSDEPAANAEQISYQYDLANRLLSKTGNGLQFNSVFDAAPITVATCWGGNVVLGNRGWRRASATRNNTVLQFGYDAAGRIIREARRDPDRECYHVFTKTYMDNGQIASITYPSGRIIEYIYPESPEDGDIEYPIQVKMTFGGIETTLLSNIIYEAGLPSQWTDGSGLRTTVTRNLDGTIAERKVEHCAEAEMCTTILNWNIGLNRDGNGNVLGITTTDSASLTQSLAFSYTNRNEIEEQGLLSDSLVSITDDWSYNAGDQTRQRHWSGRTVTTDTYNYDGFKLSNISTKRTLPNTTFIQRYTFAAGDTRVSQIIPSTGTAGVDNTRYFSYTVDGLLRAMRLEDTVDSEGETIANSRYYTYDALDRRSLRATSETGIAKTREFWNENKIWAEINVQTMATTVLDDQPAYLWSGTRRDYIHLGEEAIAAIDERWECVSSTTSGACLTPTIADTSIYYVHKNHLGAPVLLTDATRAEVLKIEYTPFGKATLTGNIEYNPRLPGQYQDNDVVYYNGHRYYEPETGRYLQPEPIYQIPDRLQAYSVAGLPLNPYAYAANNPLRFVDPDGYSPIGFAVKLTRKGIKKLYPIFDKKVAVLLRKKGKNVQMKTERLSHEVERAASCGKPIIRHKGHTLPDGSKGLPHYQQDGLSGHTFWGKLSGFSGRH